MISDNKIKCMYFNKRFNEKPQGKQCGWVQKSLIETEIAIEDLADALCHGASFKPGVLVGGMKLITGHSNSYLAWILIMECT
ncbi:hypothetical protein [Lachnospira eligens]|uniref:hypothetical protein n=1 Tax=Lachnospira eligens TaxID=39485 RepID=UPI000E4E26F6|nr:hypothetical protein [Lachnospira eligens]RHK50992.1 hypothetical protein DW057_13065 [Lachnospira eligens]RHK82901.1 hypothetical protein DW044_13925 [Lachnospira eligens]